jgi:hypothetical protein
MSRAELRLAVGVFLLCATAGAFAKGDTRRLVIAGGSLQAPLEIASPDALANVWAGTFIGAPCDPPAAGLPRFEISFDVQPPREDTARRMYVVVYVEDPAAPDGGYLYLPGRGEDGYRLNVRTILRENQDGRWHRAEARWSRAINAALR